MVDGKPFWAGFRRVGLKPPTTPERLARLRRAERRLHLERTSTITLAH